MTEPSIAVVIVAFGHAAQLPATLHSIVAQRYPSNRLQIVVVDNGGGESAAVARAMLPGALVLEPERNLGFSGGCNLGVARSSAENVVLINPDVDLRPGFLHALINALRDPSVGVAGAKLLFPGGTVLQHAGGILQMPLGLTSHRGYGEADCGAYDAPMDVEYVTGAALAARRATWDRLHGMDEAFQPAYFEEVDFGLRARAAGLRVCYVPAAVAEHGESSGLGRASVAYYRLYHANRLRLLFKHRDNDWLASQWLPAELRHLRSTGDDNEIDGLVWSYGRWQSSFVAGDARAGPRMEAWPKDPLAEAGPPAGSETAWTLAQAKLKRNIAPRPFTSSVPGVARLRGWLAGLATEEYVRTIVQQQNDLNATLVELLAALERQRRTADGAVLCQGLLLAKLLAEAAHSS